MDWDYLTKHWDKSVKAIVRGNWPKLTDADLDEIAGNRGTLYAKVALRHDMSPEHAKAVVDKWYGNGGVVEPKAPEPKKASAAAAVKPSRYYR
jgi:uncharacterized protein YjbJ (UPF0337 family)